MSEFDTEHEWLGERPPRRQAMGDLELSGGSGPRGDLGVGVADPYSDPDGLADTGSTSEASSPGQDGPSPGPSDGTESRGRRAGKRLAY